MPNQINNPLDEEFQQAKIIAISKTTKTIKRVYTALMLLFIVAFVIAGLSIAQAIFADDTVKKAIEEPPITKQIHNNFPKPDNIEFGSEVVDLSYPDNVSKNDNWKYINPLDSVDDMKIKTQDENKVFDEKTLRAISTLMTDGKKLYLQFDYAAAAEKYSQILEYENIPSSDRQLAKKFFDMSRCFKILTEDAQQFLKKYKPIRLITPYDYTDFWHEGYIEANADPFETNIVYLNLFHQNKIKEIIINKNWKIEEISGDELNAKLKQLFILKKEELNDKNNNELHPFDIISVGKFALSMGYFQGFEAKEIAHGLFSDAYVLDNFLYDTISLHKDTLYTKWIVAISDNNLVRAYEFRDRLKERYPKAWELRSREPEAVLKKIADNEAQKNDADKNHDPDFVKKLEDYKKLAVADQIAEFKKNAKLAELNADNAWKEVNDASDNIRRNEIISGAIFHWEQARKWYSEAKKLEKNQANIEEIVSILVELNKKIFWARKTKTIQRD